MALFLSSKFVRCLATIARERCILKGQAYVCRRRTYFEIRDFCRNLSTKSALQDTRLDRGLRRLDEDVRRLGRITKRELEEVLEELKITRSATSTQSLLLIRCCGSLLPEEVPESRTQLVEEVWKMLDNLGVPVDISHYNALLRVYLENKHPFSPTEFLGNLESKGIEPNRVTYQRLVERYCQEGDIEGATHILEFMRAKQLPVNENIFNSLILGHSQAGDMESAADILTVMKHAGLQPSAETYATLLCGYAKYGDMESMRSIFEQCKKEEITLVDQDYMEIVYMLAINNYSQYVDEITEKFQRIVGFNQDAINLILKLTNARKFVEAKKILLTMSRTAREGQYLPSGSFFIRQLVKANCPIEVILRMCEELKEEGLNDNGLLVASESSLYEGKMEMTNMLFSALKDQGFPIRPHYFWPQIVLLGKAGNAEGILNVLRNMQEKFDLRIEGETLREYVVPWLLKINSNTCHEVISKLQSLGIPLETSAFCLVYHLLQEKNIVGALELVRELPVNYNPGLMRVPLLRAYAITKDNESFAGMLQSMYITTKKAGIKSSSSEDGNETPILDKYEMVGQLLLDAVSDMRPVTSAQVKNLLEALCNEKLCISNSTAERIAEKLGDGLSFELSSLLDKLTSSETIVQHVVNKPVSRRSPVSGERQLRGSIPNEGFKGESLINTKLQQLSSYCKNRNLEKSEVLWKELMNDGFAVSPGIIVQLMDLYLFYEDVVKATDLLKWAQSNLNNFVLNRIRVLNLAMCLVKKNRVEDALKLLEEHGQSEKPEEITYTQNSVCRLILNHFADLGDVQNVKKFFDCLLQNNYIQVTNVILGALVKVHIVRNDLDSAVKQFEEFCHMYRCTPMKNDITCKLIEAEDAVSLQKITDLSTKIHGEVNSLYDLVFAFVECGRIRQARKILETPGLHSRPDRVQSACKRFSTEGNVSCLEGLVEVTKSLPYIDPSDIYKHLLLSYCKKDDAENAVGLWINMQEENLQPSDEFLNILGNFLKSKNMPVPFVLSDVSSQNDVDTKNIQIKNFITTLEENKFEEAMELLRSMDNNNRCQISRQHLSSLLQGLSDNQSQHEVKELLLLMFQLNVLPFKITFKNVVNKIASAGDILTLQLINQHLNLEEKKRVAFYNNLCHAYIIADKASEYLDILEKEIDEACHSDIETLVTKLPKVPCLTLLKDPAVHPQFKKICEKCSKHGIVIPYNMLWMFYAMEHQYTIADEIWNEHLSKSPEILSDSVSHFARENLDLPLAKYVVNRLKESASELTNGFAYSCVVDILLSNGKVEEAVEFLNESRSHLKYENLTTATRKRLEKVAVEKGITLQEIADQRKSL